MAMGRRKAQQEGMWVLAADLPKSPGHAFYQPLNELLDSVSFDTFVEEVCQSFYASEMGRPSLSPGRYFRLLLVGYFEGLDSERGIAWRASDSLAIRRFLRLELSEGSPDHSTISRTRRRIAIEAHQTVFTWVLEKLALSGLLKGKTLGVDATTLEANAAMRSIVRRDTGESYPGFLERLAKESGIKTPTREALARLDRRRKKKTSNQDWSSPTDPDAKVAKMKDGRTHLAHKAEHAVDLETGAVVAVTLQGADQGDTTTIYGTLAAAAERLALVIENVDEQDAQPVAPEEVVADKGYHSDAIMVALAEEGLRTYISEPDRGIRRWKGDRGRELLRTRGELLERPFAHLYETGGMRRTHLRGHTNILKRLLVHVSGFNLGLLMRLMFGVGTPRSLQGRLEAVRAAFSSLLAALGAALAPAPALNHPLDRLPSGAAWSSPVHHQMALVA